MTKLVQGKIVAVIPSLNTANTIQGIVSEAKKHVNQVIVIDDGSHDTTAEMARAAGALVKSHLINKGYGEAIKSCFKVAEESDADVLVVLDGDGQHKPEEISYLVTPILQGEADLIIGSRFLGNGIKIPRYRRFGINVITSLFNFGSRTKVTDSQSGFRAYHRNIFETIHLSEKGMSVSIETLEKARRKGAVIKEVPVSCLYTSSTLGLKAISHGLSVALSVIRLRLKNLLLGNGRGK
ncbi:glycosyltransferase family 2 protein [Chloroflexota bacterium]